MKEKPLDMKTGLIMSCFLNVVLWVGAILLTISALPNNPDTSLYSMSVYRQILAWLLIIAFWCISIYATYVNYSVFREFKKKKTQ